jgi:DNA invertase Pin-like site-specific DNA recombinase
MPNVQRMVGYLRVSTEEQAQHGYGLDAQEHELRRAADFYGWELLELVRDEGLSGSTLERPGLQRALAMVAAGDADGLVVAKLDRLTRSVVDFGDLLEWFEDARAAFVALDVKVDTSTPGGRMVAQVLVVVAEWERRTIAARTKAGLDALRAQGKPTGRPSVADRPELAERIRRMRDEEGLSLRAIADVLSDEGIPTARGADRWRASSVQAAAGYVRRKPRRKRAALPALDTRRR